MEHDFIQNTGIIVIFESNSSTDVDSYTDISSGFFPAAKERFKLFSNIEFATLDVNKDPVAQGFEEGEFDLIIAANVCTSDFTRKNDNC